MGSLLAALGLVFVAELGDKTQLVALGFGARHRLVPVLVGVAIAYMITNLLSVAVGGLLGGPPALRHRAGRRRHVPGLRPLEPAPRPRRTTRRPRRSATGRSWCRWRWP